MASSFSISVKLDLENFYQQLEQLKKGLNRAITEATGRTIEIDVDAEKAIEESEKAVESVDEIQDKHVAIDGDGSGAVSEAEQVSDAVEDIPETASTQYSFLGWQDAIGQIAKIGLALHSLFGAYNLVSRALGGLTTRSNIQEDAETSLRAALRATGLEVENNFERLRNYASAIQGVTRYGDEAIISGTALMQNIAKLGEDTLPLAQRAAVGLAARYRIDLQTAFQLIGRAAAGQTQTLTRYGIVVDSTLSKEEQFQEILRQGIDGFQIAKEEAESGAGALEQFQNVVGDLQEKLGDLIKTAILPVVKMLNTVVTVLNENRTAFNMTVSAVVALGAAFVALKIKTIALASAKAILLAFTNPLALAIASVSAGAAVLGIHLAANKIKTDAAARSQSDYNEELQRTLGLLNGQELGYRNIAEAEGRIKELRSNQQKEIQEAEKLVKVIYKDHEDIQEEMLTRQIDRINLRYNYEIGKIEEWIEQLRQQQANNEEYYEAMKWAADGYYDYMHQKLLEERDERIASGIWSEQQAEEVYEYRKALLDEEYEKVKSARTRDIDDARNKLEMFFNSVMSRRDQLETELKDKKGLIETAFAGDEEAIRENMERLYEWYNSQLDDIHSQELEKERLKYYETIKYLEAKLALGIDVSGQLLEVQNRYFQFLKEEYGKDSIEYLNALADKETALKNYWMEHNDLAMAEINAITSGFNTMWSSILDTSMTGSERLQAIWTSIRDSFFNAIGQMLTEYIKNQMIEAAIASSTEKTKQAAVIQTAAVEQGAQAATQTSILVTMALKIKDAFASIAGAIAAGFKWLVSTLGPLGLGMGAGLGAALISAFKSLLSGIGFAAGGYTGDGSKYEVAGIAHKGEVYFEQEISKPNLAELLGLRSLMQKGYKLRDIIAGGVMIPAVSKPLPKLSLASGGIAGPGQIIDFSGVEGLLSEMNYRLKKIEAKDMNVHLHGETNLIEWHRTSEKASKEYSRRIK